jgi:serine/threonine-protein kinase
MALAPGTRLGPYEIGPLLGQGGMGEVYRARDRNLRRDVALKILPTAVAADADRLARFRREAHVLASLNHPHIAQIYGLEDGDTPALVLELVDGPTLSDRIAAGPLSVLEALRVARQIAEALEAAHALDIIHRDLKPANVKVRPDGTVKVLDFGLARGADPSVGADSGVTTAYAATALGAGLTTPGAILGTAAYMSPEQAAGQAADKRSDIWSFGVVLFEMLTGRPSFNGDSFAHVLAAVMRSEPDWTALPADTPPSIRTLIRRALDKDRKRRLADIHDAWLEIDDALSAPASAAPNAPPMIVRRGSVTWWLAAALTVALSIVVVLWAPWRATAPVDRPPMRLNVDLGPEAVAGQSFDVAISPDATRLAFPARSPDGRALLATRLLSEPTQTMLPGTEGARAPFFSPDGQWIGFAAGGQIRKVAVQGGAVVSICDAVSVLGATWAEGYAIVIGG